MKFRLKNYFEVGFQKKKVKLHTMKSHVKLFALLVVYLMTLPISFAQEANDDLASSPDHPQTWASGADEIHHSLKWNQEKQCLFLHVTFSTKAYADDTHPAEEADYTLTFPTVRFDPSTDTFYVGEGRGKRIIGRRKHGFFGDSIKLVDGIQLDVRRIQGKINATLRPVVF